MSSPHKKKSASNDIPATIVKNVRACAAIICYDLLMKQDSMKLEDQYRFLYNTFHGHDEKNISSQIKLLVSGHYKYRKLFNIELSSNIVTNRDADISNEDTNDEILVLKHIYANEKRYVAGEDLTVQLLSAPTKARLSESITGRNIYDLARSSLKHLKKAIALADDWLNNGELPSGNTWDDLYSHLYDKSDDISGEKNGYTGWIAFAILTKYNDDNDDGIDLLNIDGSGGDGDGSRRDFRKKRKKEGRVDVNENRKIPAYASSTRGHTIHDRLSLIEMAKMEETKRFDDIKTILAHLNTRNKMLLEERKQAIELAKGICPKYNKENDFWKGVHKLTDEINKVKGEINKLTDDADEEMNKNSSSSTLATKLLHDVTMPGIEFEDVKTINTDSTLSASVQKNCTAEGGTVNNVNSEVNLEEDDSLDEDVNEVSKD